MAKLERGLKEWVDHGLLSGEQANRIRAYESAKPEASWVMSGLLILGAVIIAIGVISLVAANWREIPDSFKLAGNFIVLAALAAWTVNVWESKRPIYFEALLCFFILMCLASIGLIAQVYHSSGALYQALLLWSAITFAAALAARQLFVPLVWSGAFLSGLVIAALDSTALHSIFQRSYPAVFMGVPLLCAALTVVSRSLAGEIGSTRAFRWWTLLSGLVALVVAEFRDSSFRDGIRAYVPGYALAVLAVIGILASHEYRSVQKWLLLATLGIFLGLFHLPLFGMENPVAYAALSIAVLTSISIFLASLQFRRLFQFFLSLVGVRFLVLYFQAVGGLAMTGLGLIVSGGMVIGMAILWNKYRVQLATQAERWMQ